MAATQDEVMTLKRLSAGTSFLGSIDGEIVASGVIYQSVTRRDDTPEWFLRDDVAVFAQFAVAPRYQKLGLGIKVLDLLQQEARAGQKRYLACDTAEPAHDLVAYYKRRGFSIVTTMRYLDTSYSSVILSKDMAQ